ncbi:hypothetical protein NHX12_008314, partial [Muraenolepis orangiensis]
MWEGPEEPMQYLRAVVTRAIAIQSWVERAGRQALLSDTLDLSMNCSMDSLRFVTSWKSPIKEVGGLQLEGCSFDGVRLSENQHESPSVASVPPCYMAWVPH